MPGKFADGNMAWIFLETVSNLVSGICWFWNGVRTCAPFTTWVVRGSKIWPKERTCPAESTAGAPVLKSMIGRLNTQPTPGTYAKQPEVEKLPALYASVGTVVILFSVTRLSRNCSKLKKKKLLFWPLYTLGIRIGPPTVNP